MEKIIKLFSIQVFNFFCHFSQGFALPEQKVEAKTLTKKTKQCSI